MSDKNQASVASPPFVRYYRRTIFMYANRHMRICAAAADLHLQTAKTWRWSDARCNPFIPKIPLSCRVLVTVVNNASGRPQTYIGTVSASPNDKHALKRNCSPQFRLSGMLESKACDKSRKYSLCQLRQTDRHFAWQKLNGKHSEC